MTDQCLPTSLCHCDKRQAVYSRQTCKSHVVHICGGCQGVVSLENRCRKPCRPDTSPFASDGASMTCGVCGMPTCINCPGPVIGLLEFCDECLRMEGEYEDINEPGWLAR